MSRRGIVFTLVFFLSSVLCVVGQKNKPTQQQQKSRQQEEAGSYLKKWPQDEVPYIISDEEKDAFKALKTDEEREQFIEAFWLRRDQTPDTVDNEYKEQYYQLIAKANEKFTSGIPGWKTDRGRIMIMHGEPDEIQSHPMGGPFDRPIEEGGGRTNTFPFETWRYRYIEGIGNNVILEFVDTSMSGEYHLSYDPAEKDALLHVPGVGLTEYEERNGLDKADRLNRDFATAGTPFGQDTRTNWFDRLQQYYDIQKTPGVKYKDLEAVIDTRTSYNLLPFDLRSDYLRMTESNVLVPITIQVPYKSLTFKEEASSATGAKAMHATGRIEGRIKNLSGRIVGRIDDPIEVLLTPAQYRPDGYALYQKAMNLAPGLYQLFLVVNDAKSNNSGTKEVRLEVKRFPEGNLSASSLILADLVDNLPPRTVATMFQIGSLKVRPSVRKEFNRDQEMNLFAQVYGLKLDEKTHKPDVTTEVLITRDGQEVKKLTDQITEVAGAAAQMNVVKQIPMKDFDPGQYAIQLKITDKLTNTPLVLNEKFTVK